MAKKKAKLALNAYSIIGDSIEQGIAYGWQRVFKHIEKPDNMPPDETIVATIHQAVMNDLSEIVDWDNCDPNGKEEAESSLSSVLKEFAKRRK